MKAKEAMQDRIIDVLFNEYSNHCDDYITEDAAAERDKCYEDLDKPMDSLKLSREAFFDLEAATSKASVAVDKCAFVAGFNAAVALMMMK